MIGRADIEGSKSDVAMNAWPPQASYPCGNFSDTSCSKLESKVKRIERPRFHGLYSYWKSGSSQLLPFCSTRGFCPRWAGLRTPALSFDRCTAPVKLPAWHCPRLASRKKTPKTETPRPTPKAVAHRGRPPDDRPTATRAERLRARSATPEKSWTREEAGRAQRAFRLRFSLESSHRRSPHPYPFPTKSGRDRIRRGANGVRFRA